MQRRSLPRKRPASSGETAGTHGWSLLGATTILAIVSVLVLVSFSRLRGFILAENEQDALTAVRMITERLAEDPDPTTLHALVEAHGLEHRLADASFPDGQHRMQRHGYFFELVELEGEAVPSRGLPRQDARGLRGVVQAAEPATPPAVPAAIPSNGSSPEGTDAAVAPARSSPRYVVRAWPCTPGESGSTVLVGIPGTGTLGHANPARSWGGPDRPPTLPVEGALWGPQGWRRLR